MMKCKILLQIFAAYNEVPSFCDIFGGEKTELLSNDHKFFDLSILFVNLY